tara:strand:+ start:297 stop:509 length:213 start_codon:yes stop_codon:yes gene_type:complete
MTTLAVCLGVLLLFVMWLTTLKFISIHFERLKSDIYTSFISLLQTLQEGVQKAIENQQEREHNSQNGHLQ